LSNLERRAGGMTWVTIKGNRYYRRNRRENGRVVVEHVGRGRMARLEERLDTQVRELRRMVTAKERGERQEYEFNLRQALLANHWLAALFGVLAHWNGYHLHRRQWRRKRGGEMAKNIGIKAIDALLGRLEPRWNEPLLKPWVGDLLAADRALVEALVEADEGALLKVRKYTDDPAVFRRWGNPAYMARVWLVYQISGDDQVVRRAVYRQVDELGTELGREGAGYLERLAISRVVHNWLMVTALEARACSFRPEAKQRAAVERALSQAERRYTQALWTLAYIRRESVEALTTRIATVSSVEGPPAQPRSFPATAANCS
jgi:hypothetical protein